MKMFDWKARRSPPPAPVLDNDLETLEAMLLAILDIVPPEQAWQHFAPHADVVRDRAGSVWPVAEDAIQEMLARHGVSRPGN